MTEYLLSIYIIGIYIAIGICLLGLILGKLSTEVNNSLIKSIGALLISLVVITGHSINSPILIAPIIIIGLLIASELFMSLLIAFFKGGRDFINSKNFSEMLQYMSAHEISEKNNREITEIEKENTINNNENNSDDLLLKKDEIIKEFQSIEEKAIKKYERMTSLKFERHVKFNELMLDAASVSTRTLNPYFIEVKIFSKISFNEDGSINLNKYGITNSLEYTVSNLMQKIEENIIPTKDWDSKHINLAILCVFNTDKDLSGAYDAFNKLKEKYCVPHSRVRLKFIAFNINKIDIY